MSFDPSVQCTAIHPTLNERCQVRGGEYHAGKHWVIVQEGHVTAFRHWATESAPVTASVIAHWRRIVLIVVFVVMSAIGRFQAITKWRKQIWQA